MAASDRKTGAANGLLALVAGYSVAFVVALATNRPFLANGLADRIMEATPVSIATVLLSALGLAAKPFALAGALALAAALALVAGAAVSLLSHRLHRARQDRDAISDDVPQTAGSATPHNKQIASRRSREAPAHQGLRPAREEDPYLTVAEGDIAVHDSMATRTAAREDAARSDRWQGEDSPEAGQHPREWRARAQSAEPGTVETPLGDSALPVATMGLILLAAAAQSVIVLYVARSAPSSEVALAYAVWAFVMAALSVPGQAPSGRRWFLNRGFQAAAGLVLLSTAATWTLLAKTLAGAQPGRRLFAFQPPAPRQPEFTAVDGLTPEVTPTTSLYLMSKTVEDPGVDAATWRLRIGGLVNHPLELTHDELLRLPRVDQWLTLRCVSNPVGGPLIGNGFWSGVPLTSLLALAGAAPEANTLVMKARDTYSDSVPLDRATLPGSLLAYAVDGELLNRDHGFPARVLVPGLYGFKNVKWVEELELLAGDFEGPWQRLGWTRTAIQTTFSRIDFVRRDAAGVLAGGIAFAGDRGIQSVEVRAGDQPWRPAGLHTPVLGPLAWTQWLFRFQATGRVTVTVRATDATGALQEQTERPIYPNGATGWHSVTAEV